MFDALQQQAIRGNLRFFDLYFAQYLARLEGNAHPHLLLAASLASFRAGAGDVCLDLSSIDASAIDIPLPDFLSWKQSLESFSVVGKPGEIAPLILDESNRLYLGRYWWYEKTVAEAIRQLATSSKQGLLDKVQLRQSLNRLFPDVSEGVDTDWQKVAAAQAAIRNFLVISGGPGTGKTHTVAAILALLLEMAQNKRLRIALAAPTGKAAARLAESIRQLKPTIACSESVRAAIPEQAATLHRLLGVRPGQAVPKHHANNPLNLDVLVLDEASMIDLPMMARLLAAMPAGAQLILLGDKHQLASVEAGSVFGDICGAADAIAYSENCRQDLEKLTSQTISLPTIREGLQDTIVLLQKSYRFADDAGIGQLAAAVKLGDADGALTLLQNGIQGIHLESQELPALEQKIQQQVLPHFMRCVQSQNVLQALQAFAQVRVLCATREGSFGLHCVNEIIEKALRARHLIPSGGQLYAGKPILITQNDYQLELFNGDIGILWPDSADKLRAWFVQGEGEDSLKSVSPSRLPAYETAYAMTVHKSQGSEFHRVWLLLPQVESELLSRELIYTAITRAKEQVDIWADKEVLACAIRRKTKRMSGLQEKLYGAVVEE